MAEVPGAIRRIIAGRATTASTMRIRPFTIPPRPSSPDFVFQA